MRYRQFLGFYFGKLGNVTRGIIAKYQKSCLAKPDNTLGGNLRLTGISSRGGVEIRKGIEFRKNVCAASVGK